MSVDCPPRYAIGLDLGTSEVKAVLLDEAGCVVATAGCPVPEAQQPRPGWSEQHPETWWTAVCSTVHAMRRENPQRFDAVAAIGLSGQMHGAVLLDADNRVLRPTILWNDGRAVAECAEIESEVPGIASIVGSRVMPGLTAPKLRWLAAHEPEVMARLDCVMLPKDRIGLELTGERFTDMSDAAGTGWLDVAHRRWHEPGVIASRIGPRQLPRLLEGSDAAGRLRPQVAQALGLPPGVVVAAGGGDNPSAAVGIGAVDPSQAFISLGTSAALFVVTERAVVAPDRLLHGYCHALPNRWYQMGAMLSGASCLRWAANLTREPEAALAAKAQERFPDHHAAVSDAPLFLPYLAGERTPHNDPDAKGVLLGLTHASGAAHLAYAVMEGVGFGLLDALEAIRESGTAAPEEIVLVGGGSRSRYWAQLLANILATDIVLVRHGDLSAAIGAARLGFLAAGAAAASLLQPGIAEARCRPQERSFTALRRRHELFKAAYLDNRTLFRRMAADA